MPEAVTLGEGSDEDCASFSQPKCFRGGRMGLSRRAVADGLSLALRPNVHQARLKCLSVAAPSLLSEDSFSRGSRSPVSIIFSPRSSAFEF